MQAARDGAPGPVPSQPMLYGTGWMLGEITDTGELLRCQTVASLA